MADPGTSSCMRLSSRRKVDFPQPDGPIRAVTSPDAIVRNDALQGQVVAEPRTGVSGLEGGRARGRATDQRRDDRSTLDGGNLGRARGAPFSELSSSPTMPAEWFRVTCGWGWWRSVTSLPGPRASGQ